MFEWIIKIYRPGLLLNDFGLQDFVLHEFGTIQIPDTAGAIAALLISAASIAGGDLLKSLPLLQHKKGIYTTNIWSPWVD